MREREQLRQAILAVETAQQVHGWASDQARVAFTRALAVATRHQPVSTEPRRLADLDWGVGG